MTDASIHAWESEMKAILDHIRAHPSSDLTEKRARLAVLEKMIADFHANEARQ